MTRLSASRGLPPLAIAVILAAFCSPAIVSAQVVVPDGFANEIIVGGLDQPTSFAFLPDGRFFIIEQRTGKVRLVVNGAIATTDPCVQLADVNLSGMERGLLGIAVDPQWPARPFVYLYYNRTGNNICIARYTASGDLANPVGQNITLGTPLQLINDIPDLTVYHQAGCLRFGADGMLYASLGEDAMDCTAFDITSLHGEIVRLKVSTLPTGGGPQVARSALTPGDNPFNSNPNANAKLVWAYGLRNPFRFQIDPVTGTIYCGDVGEDSYEEENEIHAGNFMGWPYREADSIFVHTDCPEPGGAGSTPYVSPIKTYPHDGTNAIISGGMYRPVTGAPNNWPASYFPSRGDVFFTDYYEGNLRRITWNGTKWLNAPPVAGQPNDTTWATGLFYASDFQVGPDGSLWWMRQFNENFNSASGAVSRIRNLDTNNVVPPSAAVRVLMAAPNPFAAAVDLSFRVPSAEHVRLVIHDLTGRRVRTLIDGVADAGERHVSWSGTDERGARVPAGVYFARLERAAPASSITVRLLLTR